MPITTITWLMVLSLIGTDILIRLLENYSKKKPDKLSKKARQHFSYAYRMRDSKYEDAQRLSFNSFGYVHLFFHSSSPTHY